MLRRSLENRDAQTRQLQDAVTNVEKHFGELCQIFAAYVRKTARLRDKADLLVNEINVYASTETPNLKQGLKNFADEFAKLQDYRQAEVERLEAKVVEPLKAYGTIVKMKRDDLKATLTARNREAKQLTQLERTRQRNPSDRHVIVSFEFGLKKMFCKAETELQRATMDATRTTRHLEETIDNFEKQKIKDIKDFRSVSSLVLKTKKSFKLLNSVCTLLSNSRLLCTTSISESCPETNLFTDVGEYKLD
ncbi:CBY1-interacting BAR domain-containing protein 1 isoform X4 [Pteropus medius]|uniref:Protein FAM92A isoform X4 n=1 Tax=Pteropus vampyrus TaxID=132908 RepID=A0A6P3RJV6_PTEVA|nr:protein FAM92A isoform X4 [Pteropus vampyrus]XP_039733057.1 protein FAM92A isoform X4 [Pteropus giganteus]